MSLLKDIFVGVEYLIDKNGIIRDVKITYINTPNRNMTDKNDLTKIYAKATVEDENTLLQYIQLIIEGMPKSMPAQFQDKNVDYLERSIIPFLK
jgi:hypothetical protein